MISAKSLPIKLTAILACVCSTAQGGDGFYCNVRDGACVPKRITYGYTPTTWRRWPNEGTPSIAKPAVEEIPTPAKQPSSSTTAPSTAPGSADEAPLMPSMDESPLIPTDSAPSGSTPNAEPPLMPPFDDSPPSPPQGQESGSTIPGAANPADMPTPKSLAEPPSRIQNALPDSDLPPAMPDDDPFKDDPPGPPIPVEEPAQKSTRLKPRIEENARATATQWQSTVKPVEAAVEGPQLVPVSTAEEPRRLPDVEERAEASPALPAASAAPKHNPLRAASRERQSNGVVPTASWIVEPPAPTSGATAALRRNPLRSN